MVAPLGMPYAGIYFYTDFKILPVCPNDSGPYALLTRFMGLPPLGEKYGFEGQKLFLQISLITELPYYPFGYMSSELEVE